MAKNIYSLQLLRNGSPFTSYTDAVEAITRGTEQDGVIKLARYTDSTAVSGDAKYQTSTIKTIFGIRHSISGDTSESGWTIFDSYHEVIADLQSQINAITGGDGSIAQQIQAALDALDFGGATGNVITQVTQADGQVAASGANVGNLVLTDYTEGSESGHVEASDSINAAIAKLQNQIDAANDAKNAAIEALDANITATDGSYIDHIEQVDGKISGTTKVLPSLAEVYEDGKPIIAVSEDKGQLAASAGTINAEFVNVADAGEKFTGTTVEAVLAEIDAAYKAADTALKDEILGGATEDGNTLGKLEDRIEELATDAKEYHIVKTTTGLPEEIKERYSLVDAAGHVSGDTVDIPKDSHIVSITYDGTTQKLTYTYLDASGSTQSTDVDMSELVLETEFGSGVTVTDHVAHGVVDTTSETFLTVGANGFKLAGVQDAINAASSDANTKISELSGKTVTGIDMTGGTAAITANTDGTKKITIDTDGSKILATGYAKGSDASEIAASDSINAALAKLENQVDAAKAAATTKVVEGTDAGNNLEISSATSATDGSVTYTINLTDVASKTALDAEITARKAVDGQNGQTYAANTSANYISAATSLNDADVKLDAAIKALEGAAQTEIDAIETAVGLDANGNHVTSTGNYTSAATTIEDEIVALDGQVKTNTDDIAALSGKSVTSVTVNGVEVVSNNVAPIALGYTNEAASSESGMVITTNESTGAMDIKFGTLDCGEY